MKERPILFSAPMVRAILDGSKTQTRRVLKHQPHEDWYPAHYTELHAFEKDGELNPDKVVGWGAVNEDGDQGYVCPYGKPGDRLWVREAWSLEMIGAFGTAHGYDSTYELRFRADDVAREIHVAPGESDPYIKLYYSQRGDWRPSIHMPRWASRLLLEIVAVRVERLSDISEADGRAEGAPPAPYQCAPGYEAYTREYRLGFERLWESINGAGSWKADPWVWVVEFKRVQP